jgi:hypothetical protein
MNAALAQATSKDTGVTNHPLGFKLRAGHGLVEAAADRAAIRAVIEQSNGQHRLEGLPDHLNPEVIDPAKAEALIAALAKLPSDKLKALAGKALHLNYGGLMIAASAPTQPSAFAEISGLKIADVQGDTVLARVSPKIDCALAQSRAGEAASRIAAANDEVKSLEAKQDSAAYEALSVAKARRFAIAQAWRDNAEAWSKCPGADAAAKTALKSAKSAVKAYLAPPRSGMPG